MTTFMGPLAKLASSILYVQSLVIAVELFMQIKPYAYVPIFNADVLTAQMCKQILFKTTGISAQTSSKSVIRGNRPKRDWFQP